MTHMLTIDGAPISPSAHAKIQAMFGAPELQALGSFRGVLIDRLDKLDEPDGLAHTETYARALATVARFESLYRKAVAQAEMERTYGSILAGLGGEGLLGFMRALTDSKRSPEDIACSVDLLHGVSKGCGDALLDLLLAAECVVQAESAASPDHRYQSDRWFHLWADLIIKDIDAGKRVRFTPRTVGFLRRTSAHVAAIYAAQDAAQAAEHAHRKALQALRASMLPWNLPKD